MSTFGSSPAPATAAAATPTRGRGRGRGSRGGGARSNSGAGRNNNSAGGGANSAQQVRAPRMGRGASAVAKAIALSRPRCVGGLKHQPDPERLKDLFSPVSVKKIIEAKCKLSFDSWQKGMSIFVPLQRTLGDISDRIKYI